MQATHPPDKNERVIKVQQQNFSNGNVFIYTEKVKKMDKSTLIFLKSLQIKENQ